MDRNEQIERLIQQTLDQLERPERLPPAPYLYTRIRHRLETRSARRGVLFSSVRPALLAALVLVNIIIAVWHFTGGDRSTRTDARQELMEILAGDLNLGDDGAGPSIID